MEITEVRIKLMEDSDDRLQAFCSITFDDCFVIRDLKIIEGSNGPFVAMPSRKLTSHCRSCGCKNHLRSSYCNGCGQQLADEPLPKDATGRTKLYADIAHPINSECREMVQSRVIQEYQGELERAQQPGYRSRYDDEYDDSDFDDDFEPAAGAPKRRMDAAEREVRKTHRKASANREAGPSGEGDEKRSDAKGGGDSTTTDESSAISKPHTQLQPADKSVPAPHAARSEAPVKPESGADKPAPAQVPDKESKGRPDDEFGAGIF